MFPDNRRRTAAASKDDAAAFEDRLTEITRNLRTDLNNPELAIVVGEIGASFLTQQSEIAETSQQHLERLTQLVDEQADMFSSLLVRTAAQPVQARSSAAVE